MQYRYSNTDNIANGQANYLIIGLGGNSSQQGLRPVAPMPTPLPSSTPISTPSSTPMVTLTRTPGVSSTPPSTPASTPGSTPQPTYSPTPPVTQGSTPPSTPPGTPPSTPPSTPAVTPTPSRQIHVGWQLQQEICKYYPNTEVIYGCPEEPIGCYLPSDVGNQETSISDCYTGTGGMTRCTRQWLCVEY